MLLPSGNPFKCHEEVFYLQAMIPPKRLDVFLPDWGYSEGLTAFRFFFNKKNDRKATSYAVRKLYQKTAFLIWDQKSASYVIRKGLL